MTLGDANREGQIQLGKAALVAPRFEQIRESGVSQTRVASR